MASYDYDGQCGSCKHYTFEGDYSKGYCSMRRTYYYPDDSCQYWTDRGGSSGFCFLTTACCEYKGLPDDCRELETLRRFRDTYLKQKPYGQEMIDCYYEDAPEIVKKLKKHPERVKIYNEMYEKIRDIMDLIEKEDLKEATIEYLFMVYKLKRIM
ncbi:MAG: CFI-box-CTERM domain-containing protein [Ruminococcus sp.]|jgi:hypothetical protein